MTGLGVAIFVVAILLMILIHEAGHFFTAKAFRIKVEEFFVGFGPRIWSTKRGETEYGLKGIPLGGYVRIAGMNPYQEIAPEDRDRVFGAKPAWQRAIVLVAGSATHFVIAFLLLVSFFWFVGDVIVRPSVAEVEPTLEGQPSPATVAGLEPGDRIVEANGRRLQDTVDLIEITRRNVGREVTLEVARGDERFEVTLTPVLSEVDGEEVGRLGIVLAPEIVGRDRAGLVEGVVRGATMTGELTVGSIRALGTVFSPEGLGRIGRLVVGESERTAEDPAGIVGAGRLAGQAAASGNMDLLLMFLAFLNVFVGIFNLLPLPPLDGGHLAVLGWEKFTRRPVDVRKLIPITATVVALLIMFMLSLTYLDVVRPIPDPFQ
jgi:membrane-associated protease RseP (regulator of RpoE activity)